MSRTVAQTGQIHHYSDLTDHQVRASGSVGGKMYPRSEGAHKDSDDDGAGCYAKLDRD